MDGMHDAREAHPARAPMRWAVAAALVGAIALIGAWYAAQPKARALGDDAGSTSSPSSGDGHAYSRCMRENGVVHFPDPEADGALRLHMTPETPDLDFESTQFQEGQKVCGSLEPRLSEEEQAKHYEAGKRYAQCMRDQGVSNFPDPPTPGSGPVVVKHSGGDGRVSSNGIDPQSPEVQAADEQCKQYLPDRGEGRVFHRNEG